jgi:hypothetical protein
MLSLSPAVRIFVHALPTDMRKHFDGLSSIVTHSFGMDVLGGDYFVFLNRAKNRCKILLWDRDGLVVWAKKHKSHYPHFLLFTEIGRNGDNLAPRPAPAVGMDAGPPSFGPRRRPMSGETTVIVPPRADFAAGP